MKLKCTYNRDNDGVFTIGEIYEGEFEDISHGEELYFVKNNGETISTVCLNGLFWKFEIVEEENLLTGLQAIELMQQGKVVIEAEQDGLEPFVFKIINNNVCFKCINEDESDYQVDDNFDFSIAYKEYIEPKPLAGWERLDHNTDNYFTITTSGNIQKENKYFGAVYGILYDSANAFSMEEKAEEINFKQTLFRKLQRFSDESGGNEIDWSDCSKKFCINYDYYSKKLDIFDHVFVKQFGQVYFISREVAQQAIDLFHDDLIKYFTM